MAGGFIGLIKGREVPKMRIKTPMSFAQKPLKSARDLSAPHSDDSLMALEDLSRLRWRLVWIYDSPLGLGGRTTNFHTYPMAAWLIRKGTVQLRFPSKVENYGPGQWIFPKQAVGTQRFSEDTEILSIRFQAEWSDGSPLFDRLRTLTVPQSDPGAMVLERASARLLRFLTPLVPDQIRKRRLVRLGLVDYLEMQPLACAWLAAFFRLMRRHSKVVLPERRHETVARILDLLHSFPLDRSLRVAALARDAGLSVSQLNKLFVRETENTPAAFWKERRLNAARSRLLGSEDSIKKIAFDLSFSSPENFSNWFRAATGQSPRQFRQNQPNL